MKHNTLRLFNTSRKLAGRAANFTVNATQYATLTGGVYGAGLGLETMWAIHTSESLNDLKFSHKFALSFYLFLACISGGVIHGTGTALQPILHPMLTLYGKIDPSADIKWIDPTIGEIENIFRGSTTDEDENPDLETKNRPGL